MYRAKKDRKTPLRRWVEKNKRILPGIVTAFLLFTFYFAGLINQMSRLGPLGTNNKSFTFELFSCIKIGLTQGIQGITLMLILYIMLGTRLYLRYKDSLSRDLKDDERGFQTDESGLFGSNTLLDKSEIRNFLEVEPLKRTTGIILGKITEEQNGKTTEKVVSVSPDGKRIKQDAAGKAMFKRDQKNPSKKHYVREKLGPNTNRHVMVIGPSGSGKSFCYALPMIYQRFAMEESFIATDPKGELYSLTAEPAREKGYVVKILNLASPDISDSWNVLGELQKTSDNIINDIQKISNMIIDNSDTPGAQADVGVKNGCKNLLAAFITLIMFDNPKEEKVLGKVIDLLAMEDDKLNELFLKSSSEIARKRWKTYSAGGDRFKGNVKSDMGIRLGNLYSDTVQNMINITDIDLTLPGKTKCAYYLIMEDMDHTFRFLSSLFFSQMTNALVKLSRKSIDGKLPKNVYFILDEFKAIGTLPEFEDKLATVRSAGISMSMIFQNLEQLKDNYPNSWETLISNCSTLICLSCADLTTAKYLSERSGTASVAQEGTRVSLPVVNLAYVPSEQQHSYSTGRREVLTVGDVFTFPPDEILVSEVSADLFFIKKYPLSDMIDVDKIKKDNIFLHVPDWRKQKAAEMADMGQTKDEPKTYADEIKEKNKKKEEEENSQSQEQQAEHNLIQPQAKESETAKRNKSKSLSSADVASQQTIGDF